MAKVRIVLLGGGGFVGRHLCHTLIRRLGPELELLVVGRTVDSTFPHSTLAGDRNDLALLRELVAWRPDIWVDLALFTPNQMEDLLSALSSMAWPPRLVFAGSIAEYGLHRPLPLPVDEHLTLQPEGRYGRDKAAAWKLLAASRRKGSGTAWAVLPQLWGPGDRSGRDGYFVSRLLAGEPILLRGNGRTLMPDGYVESAAQALAHLALMNSPGLLRANVAGFLPTTPLSYIRQAARALGVPARVWHVHPREMARLERLGRAYRPVFGDYDLTLATNRLAATGFSPTRSVAEGVSLTALWHADNLQEAPSQWDRYGAGWEAEMGSTGVRVDYD